MFNFHYKDHPVIAALLYGSSIASLLHGLQWSNRFPFDLTDLSMEPTWWHLIEALLIPIYYETAGELLLASSVLLYTGTELEALWGSAKLASILLSCQIIGWSFRLLLYRFMPSYSIVVPGLYFIVVSLAVLFRRNTPQSAPFSCYGFFIGSHTPAVLFVVQLAFVGYDSAIMVVTGLLTGLFVSSQFYDSFPVSTLQFFSRIVPKKNPHIGICSSQQLLRVIPTT